MTHHTAGIVDVCGAGLLRQLGGLCTAASADCGTPKIQFDWSDINKSWMGPVQALATKGGMSADRRGGAEAAAQSNTKPPTTSRFSMPSSLPPSPTVDDTAARVCAWLEFEPSISPDRPHPEQRKR